MWSCKRISGRMNRITGLRRQWSRGSLRWWKKKKKKKNSHKRIIVSIMEERDYDRARAEQESDKDDPGDVGEDFEERGARPERQKLLGDRFQRR